MSSFTSKQKEKAVFFHCHTPRSQLYCIWPLRGSMELSHSYYMEWASLGWPAHLFRSPFTHATWKDLRSTTRTFRETILSPHGLGRQVRSGEFPAWFHLPKYNWLKIACKRRVSKGREESQPLPRGHGERGWAWLSKIRRVLLGISKLCVVMRKQSFQFLEFHSVFNYAVKLLY